MNIHATLSIHKQINLPSNVMIIDLASIRYTYTLSTFLSVKIQLEKLTFLPTDIQ